MNESEARQPVSPARSSLSEVGVTVAFEDHSELKVETPQRWADVALSTLLAEGVTRGHLDIAFVSSEAMAQLNEEHMAASKPTDVLAFPMDAPNLVEVNSSQLDCGDGPPIHLGDIVICPEVAISQAPAHSGTIESEYCLLTIHAVLHVLGHDHLDVDERIAMQHLERVHMSSHGFDHPVSETP